MAPVWHNSGTAPTTYRGCAAIRSITICINACGAFSFCCLVQWFLLLSCILAVLALWGCCAWSQPPLAHDGFRQGHAVATVTRQCGTALLGLSLQCCDTKCFSSRHKGAAPGMCGIFHWLNFSLSDLQSGGWCKTLQALTLATCQRYPYIKAPQVL
jgi:hypothetical protein